MLPAAILSGAARRHIILDGDSITAGGSYTPADTTGTQLTTLLHAACSHVNVAAGGSGAQTCPHTGWDTGSRASDRIYCIASGVNNLYSGGPDAATIIGYLTAAIAAVRAVGVRAVVISTIISSTDHDVTQGRYADRLTVNDAIRAAGHLGADRVSDPAADAWFQDPSHYGPEADGTGDGNTHPGVLGTLRLMQYLAVEVNALL